MARYTGADCRRCRREKMKLFLKGSKCDGPKCPFESRPFPPGQHGRGRTKESEYLLQLREKQKARRIYGVLEKQFRTYYEEANRRTGKTGEELLKILESRLDNVVYRAGYAQSRDQARQLVKHGHFQVNGKMVDIPSYRVTEHDIVQVREKSAELTPFVVARAQATTNGVSSADFSRTCTMSCSVTRYDGMSTILPLTWKWPCLTSWRAWSRDCA